MKNAIENIVKAQYPELASRLHLPLLATVMEIPDPPTHGQRCSAERPYYAVNVRLLMPDGRIDDEVPLIRDVPVALPGAASHRGFAGLPQPGTVVELAFAFGRPDKPFIRSVLPYQLELPCCDGVSLRWQQTATAYQEVSAAGDWRRETDRTIHDHATGEIIRETEADLKDSAVGEAIREAGKNSTDRAGISWSGIAPKIWLGSESDNFLGIVNDFMATVISALGTLASHTHTETNTITTAPKQAGDIAEAASAAGTAKARLTQIQK